MIFMYIKLKSMVPFIIIAYRTMIIEFSTIVSMIEIEFDIYAFFVINSKMTEIGTMKYTANSSTVFDNINKVESYQKISCLIGS